MQKKGKIFISYRREDSGGHAGRIYSDLINQFGKTHVFRDVDNMVAGDDFVKAIENAITSANVLLVVIGKEWTTTSNEYGIRLKNVNDFVRLEVSNAFKNNVPVIPVLVQGAKMPKEEQLPQELQPLLTLQAIEISDTRWSFDIDQLASRLRVILNWNAFKTRKLTWVVISCLITLASLWFLYKHFASEDLQFKGQVRYTITGQTHIAQFNLKFRVARKMVTGEYSNSEGDKGVFTGSLDGNSLDIKFVSSEITGVCTMKGSLTAGRTKLSAIYTCSDGEYATVEGERY